MKKPELVVPAGNEFSLRAAVKNGADAVYFGLSKFNARRMADNFTNPKTIVDYCHKHKVKAYLTLNTLIKNKELNDFLYNAKLADKAGVDAIIIQDPYLLPLLKQHCNCSIHMSTQAKIMNRASIPQGAERVILPRELSLDEIKEMSKAIETEVFCHGALCVSYSGMCYFSSFAGQRSANRGLCAQPCRKKYNSEYCLSTKELCLVNRINDLVQAGVSALKIEGRLRSYKYVGVATRIYRKAIDNLNSKRKITDEDIDNLKLVFNREFTEGLAYTSDIIGNTTPTNRGLYLGTIQNEKLVLEKPVHRKDGISLWKSTGREGMVLKDIPPTIKRKEVIEFQGEKDGTKVYKTSSGNLNIPLAEKPKQTKWKPDINLPNINVKQKSTAVSPKLMVKVYNSKDAKKAQKAGADVIYSPVSDFYRDKDSDAEFFVYTQNIANDKELKETTKIIQSLEPDGVLVGNPGFIKHLTGYKLHLNYNFNIFNDIDIENAPGLPVISPELNLKELKKFNNKNFAVCIHGNIVLMQTKANIYQYTLQDEAGREFAVIHDNNTTSILNCNEVGLFNDSKKLLDTGVKYFFMDIRKNVYKYVSLYKKILEGKKINDKRIRKGFTTGHLFRGVT